MGIRDFSKEIHIKFFLPKLYLELRDNASETFQMQKSIL